MTVLDEVRAASRRLVTAGVREDNAAFDAEVLARHALGWDRATYLSRRQEAPPESFAADYGWLVGRRERREPVSAITAQREFWGLTFEVGATVMTPRQESELIIERALRLVGEQRSAPLRVIDLGTGSGCLAIALARELPAARITASDVSAEAVALARRNARANGVGERIVWVVTSLLDGIRPARAGDGGFDLLVANLPYVPSAATRVLTPEVRDHEPWLALDGGRDGLDPLRAVIAVAPAYLAAGGHLVVEFGAGQEDTVRALVDAAPALALLDVAGDLAGIPRVAVIRVG